MPAGGGTQWSVIVDTASTTGGAPPGRPLGVPLGDVIFRGGWDPSTGSFPASAILGELYRIDGTAVVDGITFNSRDLLLAITDTPSTTTFANNWEVISAAGLYIPGGDARNYYRHRDNCSNEPVRL